MYKKLQETVNIAIASGQSSGTIRFTPQDGLVTGVVIYQNNAANTGIVTAKITDDSGNEIAAEVHIDDYKRREAAYKDGMKPVFFETRGKTYVLTINATAAFSAEFKAQLVLDYNFTSNQNC